MRRTTLRTGSSLHALVHAIQSHSLSFHQSGVLSTPVGRGRLYDRRGEAAGARASQPREDSDQDRGRNCARGRVVRWHRLKKRPPLWPLWLTRRLQLSTHPRAHAAPRRAAASPGPFTVRPLGKVPAQQLGRQAAMPPSDTNRCRKLVEYTQAHLPDKLQLCDPKWAKKKGRNCCVIS